MDLKELFDTQYLASPYEPTPYENDVAVIERLKESQEPVILYGATPDIADQIVKKLAGHHITITLVAIDDDSRQELSSTKLLKDADTVRAEDVDAKLPHYHVIIGFVKGYSQVDRIALKFKNARSVSYLSELFDLEPVTTAFVSENRAFLEDFYENLQDQHSKDSYIAYLMSKTRQDMKYLPPIFDKHQYFPEGLFQFTDHESYFDGGAFVGDTIAAFLKATGGAYRRIWAAEPDRANYRQLMKYIEETHLKDVEAVNKGIYSYAGKLPFHEEGSMLSMITEAANHYIEVDTIDNITGGAPVTYLKMDVEGAELMALKGAEQTILQHKPLLGISIYHRERDLIDIPAYIQKLVPEYKFYFRVHKKLAFDTVLYATIRPA